MVSILSYSILFYSILLGTRTIEVTYREELRSNSPNSYEYILPFETQQNLKQFSLKLQVDLYNSTTTTSNITTSKKDSKESGPSFPPPTLLLNRKDFSYLNEMVFLKSRMVENRYQYETFAEDLR